VSRAARFSPRDARDRLIVALDTASPAEAEALVGRLGEAVTFYKIGMELVFAGGLPLVGDLAASGKRVFLDMKLLDIDNTVAGAVRAITGLGAFFTTIHAYPRPMRAAAEARGDAPTGLLGVTVLTSLDDADLARAGYAEGASALVARRAGEAREAGLDGLVLSAQEIGRVRELVGRDMLLVVPGIRPAGAAAGDQKRVATPEAAVAQGADYLVVGRPVSQADHPGRAAEAIVADIERGLDRAG